MRSAPGKEGILDFGSFLQVCGLIYLIITILLFKMKPEVHWLAMNHTNAS